MAKKKKAKKKAKRSRTWGGRRPGAGRPPKAPEEVRENLPIRLERRVLDALEDRAEARDQTVGQYVEEVLLRHLRRVARQ